MHLNLDGEGTLTSQLVKALRGAIREGVLAPGVRVASTRELATALGISRNVALTAFHQLLAEGYLVARAGSGTYVADDFARARRSDEQASLRATRPRRGSMTKALPIPTVEPTAKPPQTFVEASREYPYDFRYGHVPFSGIAHHTWARLLGRAARRLGATTAAPSDGLPSLRSAIAAHLRYARGLTVAPESVLITLGVQDALHLTARLLVVAGRTVVLEEPHYLPARELLESAGARIHAVRADEHGLVTDELPHQRSALVYVTPSHQFPLGGVLSLARRRHLLTWAAANEALIFEDDYDSHFRYDARPIESLASLDVERVIYAGSFSKTISPSMRIGYLVLPDRLRESFRRLKRLTGTGAPLVLQQTLAAFMAEGHFARHLRRVGREYAEKRHVLLDASRRHLGARAQIVGSEAGLHVVLRLADRRLRDAKQIVRRAAEAGVAVSSTELLYLSPPPDAPLELLVSYARASPEQIRRGVQRLAKAL